MYIMNNKSQNIAVPYTQVLELRQLNENATASQDGNYSVNLEEEVILNEGDTIAIKSVFLDTASADSSLISLKPNKIGTNGNLEDDEGGNTTTIRMTFGKYITNVPTTFESSKYSTRDTMGAGGDDGTKPLIYSKTYSPTFTGEAPTGGVLPNGGADTQKDISSTLDAERYIMCEHSNIDDNSNGLNSQLVSFIIDLKPAITIVKIPTTILISFFSAGDVNTDPPNTRKTFTLVLNGTAKNMPNFTKLFSSDGTLVINEELVSRPELDGVFSGTFNFNMGMNKNAGVIMGYKGTNAQGTLPNFTTANIQSLVFQDAPDSTEILTPITESVDVVLPSGSYSSDEIARRITEEASKINAGGDIPSASVSNNNLYTTYREELTKLNANFIPHATTDTYTACGITRPVVFAKPYTEGDTQTRMFRLNSLKSTQLDYYVGSSRGFVLEYDTEAEKFSITGLHSPLRDVDATSSAKGAEQVRGYKQYTHNDAGAVVGFKNVWANSYSGCYITNLEPADIWTRQMKFPDSIKVPLKSSKNTILINAVRFNFTGGLMTFKDGENTTAQFNGVGSGEIKTITADGTTNLVATGSGDFEVPPSIPFPNASATLGDRRPISDPVEYFASNNPAGVPIFGGSQIDGVGAGKADEGYYKIEVSSKIRTDTYGADSKTPSLSAIISKYYSQGSFTTSYNEGAISYTHKGEPLTLTNFGVRILLPDGTLAKDINDRNAVFMEIMKTK